MSLSTLRDGKSPPRGKEDGPSREGSRSPDNECAICLGAHKDKSYTNKCRHLFCFTCLCEWSKVKTECPLCKKRFTKIYHNIRSYNDHDTYTVPKPPPSDRHRLDTNITWEAMARVRSQQLANRRRMLLSARNATFRAPTFDRDPVRPATSEFRRYIYRYNIYCEGAVPPDRALSYRRITPDFFRRNPACIHRLVPWLNRELVAILPHRDNVQFVTDHILTLIKQYDLRSDQFRHAISPYTLSYTDQFMHEFCMYAISPLDMTRFDRYAKYPPRPRTRRNSRDMPIPDPGGPSTSSAAASNSRVEESSDSDVVELNSHQSSATSAHALSYQGAITRSEHSHRRNRDRPTRPTRDHMHRRSRWDDDSDEERRPVLALHRPPRNSLVEREQRNRRLQVARYEAALDMSMDAMSRTYPTVNSSTNHHSATVSIDTPSTSVQINTDSNIMDRVRIFLDSAHQSSSEDADSGQLNMLEDAQLTRREPERSVNGTTTSATNSESNYANQVPISGSLTSVAVSQPHHPSTVEPGSPASSHSSDVIFVSEVKQWKERTPVMLSSDSELEVHRPVSSVPSRNLSSTSDEDSVRSVVKSPLPVYRRCRTPALSESSDDELQQYPGSHEYRRKRSYEKSPTIVRKRSRKHVLLESSNDELRDYRAGRQRLRERLSSTEDSDCMVAQRPTTSSGKSSYSYSEETKSKSKDKKKSKKRKKEKKEKKIKKIDHSIDDGKHKKKHKARRLSSSPDDQRENDAHHTHHADSRNSSDWFFDYSCTVPPTDQTCDDEDGNVRQFSRQYKAPRYFEGENSSSRHTGSEETRRKFKKHNSGHKSSSHRHSQPQ